MKWRGVETTKTKKKLTKKVYVIFLDNARDFADRSYENRSKMKGYRKFKYDYQSVPDFGRAGHVTT